MFYCICFVFHIVLNRKPQGTQVDPCSMRNVLANLATSGNIHIEIGAMYVFNYFINDKVFPGQFKVMATRETTLIVNGYLLSTKPAIGELDLNSATCDLQKFYLHLKS